METSNEEFSPLDNGVNSNNCVKQEKSDGSVVPLHISSSTRLMRNLAEKMRRDKLNTHISELAAIVPMVATATKRIDKTSVLRLSAAYLRIHQNILSGQIDKIDWKPYFLNEDNLSSMLMEAVNGFLLITTTSGKIIYVSKEIEKILGHSPVDVVGHSLFTIIHPDDHLLIQQQMQNDQESNRRSFYCHFAERCLSRNDCGRYSLVHALGHIRSTPHHSSENQDLLAAVQENLFIGIVRLLRNRAITELSLLDGCHDEYITHHSLDGRIICADHRISIIAGFLPEEVVGKSAYEYILLEDIPVSLFVHRHIFSASHGTIKAMYRLHTKTDKLIYLKSQGILQYNSVTGEMDSFICVNKLLSDKQGKLELQRFQTRYTPTIKEFAKDEETNPDHKHQDILICSSSNYIENPSTLEELWSPFPVPFPLSFLPSESMYGNKSFQPNTTENAKDTPNCVKKFKHEPDSSDQMCKSSSPSNSKRNPCDIWDDEAETALNFTQIQTSKNCFKKSPTNLHADFCSEKVTSTTSEDTSVQRTIPKTKSSGDDKQNHQTNKPVVTCTKRGTRKRTKQSDPSCIDPYILDKFYHENYPKEKKMFIVNSDSQIPTKKFCRQKGVSEAVCSTTNIIDKTHPR